MFKFLIQLLLDLAELLGAQTVEVDYLREAMLMVSQFEGGEGSARREEVVSLVSLLPLDIVQVITTFEKL